MADKYLRNLPVPFFSQRQNDYLWEERYTSKTKASDAGMNLYDIVPNGLKVSMDCRTCNITSVMIVKNKRVVLNCDKNINNKYKFNNKEPDKQNGLTWTDHYKNIRKRVFGCTNTETNM